VDRGQGSKAVVAKKEAILEVSKKYLYDTEIDLITKYKREKDVDN